MTPKQKASWLLAAFLFSVRADATRVTLVSTPQDAERVRRLARELEALGMQVSTAGGTDADVVVRLTDGSVLLERVPGGGVSRIDAKDPLMLAEEIRARLLPARGGPSRADPPRPISRRAPPGAGASPMPWEVSLSGHAFWGAANPGAGTAAELSWTPEGRIAPHFALAGLVQAVPESIARSAGRSTVRSVFVGPEVGIRVRSPVLLQATLSALLTSLWFSGEAPAPYSTKDEQIFTFSPALHLRAGQAWGRLRIFGEARAGFAAPPVRIRFSGEQVAVWGSPWFALGAGAGFAF